MFHLQRSKGNYTSDIHAGILSDTEQWSADRQTNSQCKHPTIGISFDTECCPSPPIQLRWQKVIFTLAGDINPPALIDCKYYFADSFFKILTSCSKQRLLHQRQHVMKHRHPNMPILECVKESCHGLYCQQLITTIDAPKT